MLIMKQTLRNLLATGLIALCCSAVLIQGETVQTSDQKLISEVNELRRNLLEAIKRQDKKSLENLYVVDFTHTHASGQVDDKTKRIATLVSGEPTIESAGVDEINIRLYGKNTAIATGQSTVKNRDESIAKYRWTTVYVKTGKNWQIVASQATRLAEK